MQLFSSYRIFVSCHIVSTENQLLAERNEVFVARFRLQSPDVEVGATKHLLMLTWQRRAAHTDAAAAAGGRDGGCQVTVMRMMMMWWRHAAADTTGTPTRHHKTLSHTQQTDNSLIQPRTVLNKNFRGGAAPSGDPTPILCAYQYGYTIWTSRVHEIIPSPRYFIPEITAPPPSENLKTDTKP